MKVAELTEPGRRRRLGWRRCGPWCPSGGRQRGWTLDQAVRAVAALGPLEYLEQPCATAEEPFAQLRRGRSTYRWPPTSRSARHRSVAGGQDAGRRHRGGQGRPARWVGRLLDIAAAVGIRWWCRGPGFRGRDVPRPAGRGVPRRCRIACGLGTGGRFVEDVAEVALPTDGFLPVGPNKFPDPARLVSCSGAMDRRQWWIDAGAGVLPAAVMA